MYIEYQCLCLRISQNQLNSSLIHCLLVWCFGWKKREKVKHVVRTHKRDSVTRTEQSNKQNVFAKKCGEIRIFHDIFRHLMGSQPGLLELGGFRSDPLRIWWTGSEPGQIKYPLKHFLKPQIDVLHIKKNLLFCIFKMFFFSKNNWNWTFSKISTAHQGRIRNRYKRKFWIP